jgi:aminoglycoside/choline kinase family phosphotransferase
MVLPEESLKSEEASSGPVPAELPFIEVQRFLAAAQFPVPEMHLFDRVRGHLWLDDLGNITLLEQLNSSEPAALYRNAIDLLIQFQHAMAQAPADFVACQRQFESSLLTWELEHYLEWRVQEQLQRTPTQKENEVLAGLFEQLVGKLQHQPQVVCHRDFQSTNLMVKDRGLVLIDFQDALIGPYSYDLVSLLRDSYVPLESAVVDELIGYYLDSRRDLDGAAFRKAFDFQTVQRKLKDAGRFVYIDRVKEDSRYLKWVDSTLAYVRHALARQTELAELYDCLKRLDPEAFE